MGQRPMSRMPIITIQKDGDDLQLGAADRQEDEQPGEHPEDAHPSRQQPDALGGEHHADHARGEREPGEQVDVLDDHVRSALRERVIDGVAREVVADGEVVGLDGAHHLVPDADDGHCDPAAEHERAGQRPGLRAGGSCVASNRSSRISSSATMAIAASTLPAISGGRVVADEFDLRRPAG